MNKSSHEEMFRKAWPKIMAKAWSDSAFKQRLVENPTSVFAEYGIEIPSDTTVEMHENSGTTIHLTLPEKPEGELSEEKLEAVAAGTTVSVPRMYSA